MDKFPWKQDGQFSRRQYGSYEEYKAHQMAKFAQFEKFYNVGQGIRYDIRKRIPPLRILKKGYVVLCLGARAGGEVQGFLDLDCFAVGIDIQTWPDDTPDRNPYVVYGDFHRLQFANESVDVVYFNCLDHALHISRIAKEIYRVLKNKGILLLELKAGSKEKHKTSGVDYYDCFRWTTRDVAIAQFVQRGFSVKKEYRGCIIHAPFGYVLIKKSKEGK